jgi:hypothetical protein
MASIDRPRTSRREVARKYGHPWPWRIPALVEEYAVDRDVDLRDLADRWGVNAKLLADWVRRHGFRVEQHRAVR